MQAFLFNLYLSKVKALLGFLVGTSKRYQLVLMAQNIMKLLTTAGYYIVFDNNRENKLVV